MGCSFELGDDFEKCDYMIGEYEDLIAKEQTEKFDNKIKTKITQEKEDLKFKIKEMLENINSYVDGVAQIEKLQKLNENYQILLEEESKIIE